MNEILGTLNKLTKTVTQTSGTVLKSTKLNMSLANEEDSLKSVYIDIGKKVHEIYLYGGNLGKFFDEKYTEIIEIEKRINEIREQLDVVKGTRACPKCNKRMERNAEFCQKCGHRMASGEPLTGKDSTTPNENALAQTSDNTEVSEREAIVAKQEKLLVEPVKCRGCGSENPPDEKFCLSCGRIL